MICLYTSVPITANELNNGHHATDNTLLLTLICLSKLFIES